MGDGRPVPHVPRSAPGCRTGNGEKLSSSQAEPGHKISCCLISLLFLAPDTGTQLEERDSDDPWKFGSTFLGESVLFKTFSGTRSVAELADCIVRENNPKM